MQVLFSWLGSDELSKPDGPGGPLTQAIRERGKTFDRICLLNNLSPEGAAAYVQSLPNPSRVSIIGAPLVSPVDYREIHSQAVKAVDTFRARAPRAELSFLLNSGTPPMGSVWLLLGKSRYHAQLLAWSNYNRRVEDVDVPFEISAEFVPILFERTDAALRASSAEPAPVDAAFTSIVGQCRQMHDLIDRARRVALHSVPILLEGESGTGKEILARAIHNASPRSKGPFISVNCGAVPENLAESEFFGHVKGSFTGADQNRTGHFRAAHGGVLFLDEIGDLPLHVQVKLLRPLQEREVIPVGASAPVPVDVRIIAATHRNLVREVRDGRFREDLFYRLAIAILRLPAVREREGDVSLLVEHLLKDINKDNRTAGLAERSLTPSARNRLLSHTWPGNVRELANTLRRAAVWSSTSVVGDSDIEDAILPIEAGSEPSAILDRPMGAGFSLDEVLNEVQQHYIARALDVTHGKKIEAARMLGLKSHQVLNNRLSPKRGGTTGRSV